MQKSTAIKVRNYKDAQMTVVYQGSGYQGACSLEIRYTMLQDADGEYMRWWSDQAPYLAVGAVVTVTASMYDYEGCEDRRKDHSSLATLRRVTVTSPELEAARAERETWLAEQRKRIAARQAEDAEIEKRLAERGR